MARKKSGWLPGTAGAQDDSGGKLDPELARHLAESMQAQMAASPPAPPGGGSQGREAAPPGEARGHRLDHSHDQFVAHGRAGQEAAVTAVHRTRRPQMKHSS